MFRTDSPGTRRTPTPSKQVNLTSVRRKPEDDGKDYGSLDWKEHEQLELARLQSPSEQSSGSEYTAFSTSCATASSSDLSRGVDKISLVDRGSLDDIPDPAARSYVASNSTITSDSGADAEDEEEEDTEDEEERKAPNELLMEFVGCLMQQDYENAEKLCRMILLYEPDNAEALKFMPVIEEKLQLLAEQEEESSTEEEEDETGDEDSGGESGDTDSDDSESSDDNDDEDDEDDQKKDSGIASSATE
ncbi:unnamed protein product [Owenia fusiformis]|uniref:Uncharacterized protein n=1 Tax=Owenia fusiformis TaxID=6347 RepID=A0A8J1U6V5_OWEFU|nr:unnamed protein product [Owenia fusiformis]